MNNLWVLLALIWGSDVSYAMLSRHQRSYDAAVVPAGQRLRENLQDLYASNLVPGNRVQELVNDGDAAGAGHLRDLTGPLGKNAARHLRSKFLKNSQWPSRYTAKIRTWNVKRQEVEQSDVSFLLPHEFIATLVQVGDPERLYETRGLDPKSLEHLRSCEAQAGRRLVAVGLWGDGAPCNWDRTESIEVFSMNLPGLSGIFTYLLYSLLIIICYVGGSLCIIMFVYLGSLHININILLNR